jgi:NADH-quinone oxidoreductase subunit I
MLQRIGQALRGAALMDFIGAMGLGLQYMWRPKATVQYPHERNPQ